MEETKDVPVSRKNGGTNAGITGCRFSLSVMSDGYANAILGAVGRVNTRKLWSGTDALSTVYRGKRVHVVDAVKACLVHVNDGRTHATMEATFSRGCPGDADGDSPDDVPTDDAPVNAALNPADKKFNVLGKISLYPLGIPEYTEHIAHAVNLTKDMGVFKNVSRYATEMQGDVDDIFDCLNAIMNRAEESVPHYVLQVTLSVNSPSLANGRDDK